MIFYSAVHRALVSTVGWSALLAFPLLGGLSGTLSAQQVEERFPGVALGLTYDTRPLPTLAIQPFTGRMGGEGVATRVEQIISRDLGYSNRFNLIEGLPASIVRDEVDYLLWDQLRVTWLVTGRVEGTGAGAELVMELHDVVYREVAERGRFPLQAVENPDFRLSVHRASDAVVEWVYNEPGIAATRIVFSRRMDDGTQELWIVDSDGENLRRLTQERIGEGGYALALSPTWAPDGSRIAYTSYRSGIPRIYELNLRTGAERMIPAPREGDYLTPAYAPDGQTLAFAITGGGRSGLYSYNVSRDCCFTSLIEGRWDEISPTFSPDGQRIAFNSNRLGSGTPQIYLMPATGTGNPQLLSPYEFSRQGYYTSPDWSPVGNRVAFHGRVEQRGAHQILVASLDDRNRLVRLTFDGVNEDPSWAPDGRHLVYVGQRSWGHGLFITDWVTGNTRTLVSGIRPNIPAWSPPLAP